jgi:NAD-dependent deacetylase
MNHQLQRAAEWIRSARSLVAFTGAGISAESGVPTFRDTDGFWREFPPERFATWRGLLDTAVRRPKQLAKFVHAVVAPIADAQPNAAHRALAVAEEHLKITVVTQNIDRLHQEAGSTTVYEVHGSLFETRRRSGRFHELLSRREMQQVARSLERCTRGLFVRSRFPFAVRRLAGIDVGGIYFPRLVLFGDALAQPDWQRAQAAAAECDVMLQVGCSGVVMPAAMLPHDARANGARVITVDPQEAAGELWLRGTAGEVVPELFRVAFG